MAIPTYLNNYQPPEEVIMRTRGLLLIFIGLAIAGIFNFALTRKPGPKNNTVLKERTIEARYYEDAREFTLTITEGDPWNDAHEEASLFEHGVRFRYHGNIMTASWIDSGRTDALHWHTILQDQLDRMHLAGYTAKKRVIYQCFSWTVPGKAESDDCRII